MAKNVTHGIKDTWLIENQSYAGDEFIIIESAYRVVH